MRKKMADGLNANWKSRNTLVTKVRKAAKCATFCFCHLLVTERKGSQTVFTELNQGIVLCKTAAALGKSANIIDLTIFFVV